MTQGGKRPQDVQRTSLCARWPRKFMLRLVVLVLVYSGGVPTAWSQEPSQPVSERGAATTAPRAALQVAAFLGTIPYGAAKVAVALVGGITGGLGYVLSGGELDGPKQIWAISMQGTYVLTPAHLQGDEPIRFVGPIPSPPQIQSKESH